MLSHLEPSYDSVGTRDKELPSTPSRPPPALVSDNEEKKPPSPTQTRLEDLERKLTVLSSEHTNISQVVRNLESLLPPNPVTHDSVAKIRLEKRLEEARREMSRTQKEKMEVGILITRLRRKLDESEGRQDRYSFIWSRKWSTIERK